MAKQSKEEPAVRKSVLVVGGIVVAVAAVVFALMTFLGGGGSGEAANPPAGTPAPASQSQDSGDSGQPSSSDEGLRAGGRNPFVRG